ncbi:hypothetical protein BGW39_007417 [Mortierella sp. 14UC]|nr:hypothetical protein BGW39_007417 [Mortierella sp. 14UC]
MASNESTHIDDSQVQMMQHLSTDHFHEKERSIHFVTPSRDNSGAPYLSMVDIHYTLECCGEIVIFRDEHEELPVDIRE